MAFLTTDLRMDFLSILLAIVVIGIAYLKWKFTHWQRRCVQTPLISFPFGNVKNVFMRKTTLGLQLKEFYDEFKSKGLRYCGFYFLAKPVLLVFDPDLIRLIMTKDFQHFTDHANYVNEKNDPLTGHIFSLKGLKWKNLRAKLTPTFTTGKMKMMFHTLVECSDGLVVIMDRAVKDNTGVDIKETVARFTTDVIGSCAFGIDCKSLQNPDSEFRQYGKRMFEGSPSQALKALLSLCFPAILDFFKIPLIRKDVSKFFMNVVKQTVNYREENNVTRKDFMQLLIQLKNNISIQEDDNIEHLKSNGSTENKSKVGKSLTIEEVAAQAFVFFLAGFETSSTTLTFCFYELVTNPTIQDKLRHEINETLDKHNGKISYDAISEMTYMDKCINETLRKYPPVPVLQRECTITYKVPNSNVVLEKGDAVFLPIYAIQHDSEYYPNPEKFDPERFSSENKAERHAFTWLPFGEGPRACIGLRFGMMQTKVALTILLKNYNFGLHPNTKVPLVLDPKSFILSAAGGVWLTAEKITK